jgi:hypothetical protein
MRVNTHSRSPGYQIYVRVAQCVFEALRVDPPLEVQYVEVVVNRSRYVYIVPLEH